MIINKTLIVGDLHIGKGLSIGKASVAGLNSRISDQIKLLDWILQTAIRNSAERIILTGDIFEDLKPETNLVILFINWLYACSESNVEIHIILGNHDLKRVGNRYTSVLDIINLSDINGIHIYNDTHTLHTEGVSFTLLPFRDRRSLEASSVAEGIEKMSSCLPFELASIPYGNDKVVVGHYAFEKAFFTDELDDVANELMLSPSVFEGYDYVWMGHVHRPHVLSKSNPYAAHVGSLDISDFGETEQKKIIILYDPNSDYKYKELQIPTRPLVRIRLDIPKDEDPTEYLLSEINSGNHNFENALVKLEIKILHYDSIDLDRKSIIDRLNELGVFHISSFSETKVPITILNENNAIKDSAIDAKSAVKLFAEVLDHNNDDEKEEFMQICLEFIKTAELKKK